MKKRITLTHLILALAVSLFLTVGCAKKPVTETTAPVEAPVVTEQPAGEEVRGIDEQPVEEAPVSDQAATDEAAARGAGLERIFFDFNEFTLTPEARQTLAANAEFLQAHPSAKVLIEGHCDERGSDEYNLALGERRARAAYDYLVSLGVAADRLSVISYGEERPLDQGSTEAAWAKNRRAELQLR